MAFLDPAVGVLIQVQGGFRRDLLRRFIRGEDADEPVIRVEREEEVAVLGAGGGETRAGG